MNPLILVAVIFLATIAAVYGLSVYLGARRNAVQDRLDQITGGFNPYSGGAGAAGSPGAALSYPGAEPMFGNTPPVSSRDSQLPTINQFLEKNNLSKKLRLSMTRAGVKIRPGEFAAMIAVSTILFAFIGIVCTRQVITTLVMAILGFSIPLLILNLRISSRKAKFDAQIPDVLVLVASSLRTGYSFMHSMELVVKEMSSPISDEFAWAFGEASLGVSLEIVLDRMVARMKSYDLELVATAVSIQLQVGGNLAEILDTIAQTIRERIRIRAEVAALTAEGKLSGIILFLLPLVLALFITLREPEYFKPLLDDPLGNTMIFTTLIVQLVGGVIISQMVKMDL